MIIVRLRGGLGNQMFQYALGRTLSLARGTSLKLDLSPFRHHRLRSYALGRLNVHEDFAAPGEVRRAVVMGWLNDALERISGRPPEPRAWSRVRESGFRFDGRIFHARENCILDGYWQSEKYFASAAGAIRRDFTLKDPLDSDNEVMAQAISSCNSVSVHVRRGDFVTDPRTLDVHGTCSPDYYREAGALIAGKVDDPRFFMFSDDPEWARSNIRLGKTVTQVTHNGPERPCADLHLMSLCRHHIIANSSLSWWGAWLATRPSKIVVAPKQWFRNAPHDTSDLIPDGWIRI